MRVHSRTSLTLYSVDSRTSAGVGAFPAVKMRNHRSDNGSSGKGGERINALLLIAMRDAIKAGRNGPRSLDTVAKFSRRSKVEGQRAKNREIQFANDVATRQFVRRCQKCGIIWKAKPLMNRCHVPIFCLTVMH